MAVDTKARRKSALHFARKWSGPAHEPGGTVNRQVAQHGYLGILAGALAAVVARYSTLKTSIGMGI